VTSEHSDFAFETTLGGATITKLLADDLVTALHVERCAAPTTLSCPGCRWRGLRCDRYRISTRASHNHTITHPPQSSSISRLDRREIETDGPSPRSHCGSRPATPKVVDSARLGDEAALSSEQPSRWYLSDRPLHTRPYRSPHNAPRSDRVGANPASTPCPRDEMLGVSRQKPLDPDKTVRLNPHPDDAAAATTDRWHPTQCAVATSLPWITPATSGSMSDTTTALTRRRHAIDALSQLPPGTQIGRYEIRALLGVGGMGAVYDAHDTELGRAVALKLLHPERSEVSGLADRLVHESRLMARIAHPSVIAVYDAGHQGSSVFIAMELVRGSTLAAWLASHELDWRAIVALFERAGQGLVAAHTAGIIHRDFKPENVLVARDADKVVVTDFGLAREAEDWSEDGSGDPRTTLARRPHEARMTTDGAVIGTPAYMAPEQIAARAVDVRADVFAFSVSLWAALFGQRPFPGASVVEIYAAMHLPLAPPPAGAPRVPRRLLRALRRGLAIDARDRWPDMQSLLVELAAIRGARRRRALAAGGVGIIGVIGLGIAALLVGRPPPTVDPCVRALAQLDGAYTPALAAQVRSALAGDPKTQSSVLSRLAATAGAAARSPRIPRSSRVSTPAASSSPARSTT
jgi:hypothetical protein